MRIMYAKKINKELRIFLLIFLITFTVYSFSSHGHRNTPDEYLAFVQAKQIATLTPAKDYIPEETRLNLQLGGHMSITKCENGILCSFSAIGYSISYVPFILIENTFHIIPNFSFTQSDFDDPQYVWWRNSLGHDETFVFLFFGPMITALSVCTFFKIVRIYGYNIKTSVFLSFLYGFSTIAWAYSTTGFNNIEGVLLILVSFLFFKRFKETNNSLDLVICGLSLGFGYLVRSDSVLFAIVLFVYLIFGIINRNVKIRKFVCYIIPLIIFSAVQVIVDRLRFGAESKFSSSSIGAVSSGFHTYPFQMGLFGLLFSPGAGIFIFSPILFTTLISFIDFFKKNKHDCILFLSYFALLLIFYGTISEWHGFVSWSARYMLPIISFLLIPLGSTIEKRKSKTLLISVILLCAIGVLFNLVWVAQDVNWFVWGVMGEDRGLYALGDASNGLRLSSAVFWTFQYSQLTQAIMLAFTHLQSDLILFKILTPSVGILLLFAIIIPSSIYLLRLVNSHEIKSKKESNTSI